MRKESFLITGRFIRGAFSLLPTDAGGSSGPVPWPSTVQAKPHVLRFSLPPYVLHPNLFSPLFPLPTPHRTSLFHRSVWRNRPRVTPTLSLPVYDYIPSLYPFGTIPSSAPFRGCCLPTRLPPYYCDGKTIEAVASRDRSKRRIYKGKSSVARSPESNCLLTIKMKMNRINGLRVDTDGANESHMATGEAARSQGDPVDPFALIAAMTGMSIGQSGSNGSNGSNGYGTSLSPTTPLTPTTP